MAADKAALIATLGTEPQVVTLALQALVARDHDIDEVIVVHTMTADPKLMEAVWLLDDAFDREERLARWHGHYHSIAISNRAGPVADILAEEDFGATLAVLYRVVRDWKQAGYRIHLNLSGGRKLMSICAMTAAQLLFDEGDHLWYLRSSPGLVASRALFADGEDQVTLVDVPLLRWSPAPPILTDMAQMDDPVAALTRQHEQIAISKMRFLQQDLTPAEREVAELLIRTGGSDAELAQCLYKSRRTVSRQLESIYAKLRVFLGVREDVRVDRSTLIAEFAGLLHHKVRENSP